MAMRDRMEWLQVGSAIGTWLIVTGFVLYLAGHNPGLGVHRGGFVGLITINLLAMVYVFAADASARRARQVVHGVGLAAALGAGWLAPIGFVPIYTIVWLAVAGSLYPARALWVLLAGITAAWYAIMQLGWQDDSALITAVLFATFHLFALLTARTAAEAERARDEAEFLNRELVATQHLLSEASRQSERTRIARDLHDLLGHHLTALSINLQVAERLAGVDGAADGEPETADKLAKKIVECRALARLLLSDVREAVTTLRAEATVDFDRALRLLVENVPQLTVELDMAGDVAIDKFEVAEGLLRCVQEALTNTLRHAGATRSWIRVWTAEQHVHLECRDNGAVRSTGGGRTVIEGNGLLGMRERVARLDGVLALDTVGGALRLRVSIPQAG